MLHLVLEEGLEVAFSPLPQSLQSHSIWQMHRANLALPLSELQVWPQAHPDLELSLAGSQWLRCCLQPQPPCLYYLPIPVWLQHLGHFSEHRYLE